MKYSETGKKNDSKFDVATGNSCFIPFILSCGVVPTLLFIVCNVSVKSISSFCLAVMSVKSAKVIEFASESIASVITALNLIDIEMLVSTERDPPYFKNVLNALRAALYFKKCLMVNSWGFRSNVVLQSPGISPKSGLSSSERNLLHLLVFSGTINWRLRLPRTGKHLECFLHVLCSP